MVVFIIKVLLGRTLFAFLECQVCWRTLWHRSANPFSPSAAQDPELQCCYSFWTHVHSSWLQY